MNIYNIPSTHNFLETLCNFLKKNISSDLKKTIIILPTRRSCNELKRIFLNFSENKAVILPKIKSIGDINFNDFCSENITENEIIKIQNYNLSQNDIQYKFSLIKNLLNWKKLDKSNNFLKKLEIAQICDLSLELKRLLDEIDKNKCDIDNLNNIVPNELAQHWEKILEFLKYFLENWSKYTEEKKIISISNYKTKIINVLSNHFKTHKPHLTIIFAGITENTTTIKELLKNTLQYDNCYFFIKNTSINDINSDWWKEINYFHPKFKIKQILDYISDNISIKDITNYNKTNNLSKKLIDITKYFSLPYQYTNIWKTKINISNDDISNFIKIECENSNDELKILSCIGYYYYNKFLNDKNDNQLYNKSIAIIVSDNNFADKLEIFFSENFHIKVNNAFGNKVIKTPLIKYLLLILNVFLDNFSYISILSLLKNPFSLFGYDNRDELNKQIIIFEEFIATEQVYTFDEIQSVLNQNQDVFDLIMRIKNLLTNFENDSFLSMLDKHLEIAKNISCQKEELLKITEFEDFFKNIFDNLIDNNDNEQFSYNDYKNLLHYFLSENSYSDKYELYPIINIISPDESTLINYELVIISNLTNGSFPMEGYKDPWLNKNMRYNFNLPLKDEKNGLLFSYFIDLLYNSNVILTYSKKNFKGESLIKSKFLMRFETFLQCQNLSLKKNDIDWKYIYDELHENENKTNYIIQRPSPTIQYKYFTKISSAKIEKLVKNPYNIYIDEILKLKKKNYFFVDEKQINISNVRSIIDEYTKFFNENKTLFFNKKQKINEFLKYSENELKKIFEDSINFDVNLLTLKKFANKFVNDDNISRQNKYEINLNKFYKILLDQTNNFEIFTTINRFEKKQNNHIDIIEYISNTKKIEENLELIVEAIIMNNNNYIVDCVKSIKYKDYEKKEESQEKLDKLMDETLNKLNDIIKTILNDGFICFNYDKQDNFTLDYQHLSRIEEWSNL